ncbi:UDP-N-acetylglucosamine diphosphorylase/glucosamine-1-phosphate N-acetyltransferase [Erysipelothrix sp. HDW6A]|uniref:bifunctional UDP-N-acetylglucosamine diphosphorylase/glucosamine-1-phosphate N-acetyltransferase GlmU n=1 Tax=Erysipelothrix sp. HDW6A TaxID=2714928 RepID=UPI00140D2F13|nr:bifunctional UDP-N-acetylglucosamine diphosphorylase/glucosamine-1-phosphate N-acetyltransferase GlmU [Erysipelothrix sp. HDW6A]QIK56549.1 UDP-N-acetylglucosamine diphosphorylase/glucosamine-1-phosphate N-acetyltransferase [Erysipelothrix sp. HDW6A]
MKNAIILASGKGTRMQSETNKVLHEILKKPMIEMLVDNLDANHVDSIITVVGHQREQIMDYLGDRVTYAIVNDKQTAITSLMNIDLGTEDSSTLILFGDIALLQADTIESIYSKHEGYDLTLVTSIVDNAADYRRVVRDNQGAIDRVVDHRSADMNTVESREISLGVFCVKTSLLHKYLPELVDEHYENEMNVVRLVEIMKQNGHSIQGLRNSEISQFLGINDRVQLYEASQWLQEKINRKWMENGVTIINPDNTFIGPDVIIGKDVTIYPNNHIYGKTVIGKGSEILPDSWLENAVIGDNTHIDSSRITDSSVGNNASVGPHSHLRLNCKVGDNTRIGNFVEFKTVEFGDLSRSAHLTYLGNAVVGKDVNIGCGVVTANYDGVNKHKTVIGDGVFIGSHTALIAPVSIGNNALTAAGSVVTEDVEDGAMAIARSRQTNKEGYGFKFKDKEGKKQ